jgi:DNA-binding XRE family transcriptional regulator
MLFKGRIWKEGGDWIAEAPLLDVITQGKTRTEAGVMLSDAIESLANKKGFTVRVVDLTGGEVAIESDDVTTLFAMSLKRLREAHGLSMAQVAKAIGSSSKNGYARYETGEVSPSIEKAEELLRAVSPGSPIVLGFTTTKR